MNNILQQFYNNETQRETIHSFLIEILKELAIDKTFKGEDVKGIKEAKEAIEKAFDRLDELYKVKEASISNSR